MRIAFTIVLNNKLMLQKQVAEGIFDKFDLWIVVEGAAENNGSTGWCKPFPVEYVIDGKSIDGTHEYLTELVQQYPNQMSFIWTYDKWQSKDDQVNAILDDLEDLSDVFLWEVDVDEFWDKDSLNLAEYQLKANKAKAASFLCDYLIGFLDREDRQLIVKGGWGEGNTLRYNRLWAWEKGDQFLSHEPPIVTGQTKTNTLELPYRFTHYSYCDSDTVLFKDKWYGGHEGIFNNWLDVNYTDKKHFPLPISEFLPDSNWVDDETKIHIVRPPLFDLYIQWFESTNEERNLEIIKAIKKNSTNRYIRKILIFAESEFKYDIDKVEVITLGRRMTYLDCFQHIKYCSDHDGYFAIANSDIIIPEETTKKFEYQEITLDKTFVALSRWEYLDGEIEFIGYEMAPCSQDTWIFKKEDIDLEKFKDSNFYLGICACDNRIARIAHDAGLRIINPSLYLKTIHLHESRYRTYANNSGLYGIIVFINPTDNLHDKANLVLTHSLWEKPIYV